MHQHVCSFLGSELTLCFLTQVDKVQPIAVDGDEIKVLGQVKTCNLGFPQLEGVMLVDGILLFRNQVIDLDAVCVHVNRLIADHQLLALVHLVSDNHDVCIVNI